MVSICTSVLTLRAHVLVGYVQHLGEGNLPKALYHPERGESRFIKSYSVRRSLKANLWRVYHRIQRELVYVHGEMDHQADKNAHIDAL